MKTFMAKTGQVEREWWLFDAEDQVVGRMATKIATLLMGKHRPTFTPHVDTGDFVVVVNAEKIHFSGKKWEQKKYTGDNPQPLVLRESSKVALLGEIYKVPDTKEVLKKRNSNAGKSGLQARFWADGLPGPPALVGIRSDD